MAVSTRSETAIREGTVGRTAGGVDERLAELRQLAASDPIGARDQVWAWVGTLGWQIRSDRAAALQALGTLFAAGRPPSPPHGATEGRLVGWATHRIPDRVLAAVTDLWLPWVGKRFDAAIGSGDNLMTGPVRVVGRAVWPQYRFGRFGDKTSGFSFTTWREPGKLDPQTGVLVIDYDSVPSNPRLLIRSIRDELVELVPGANLGKMLRRSGRGDRATYTMLAYFALKSPVG